MKEARFGIIFEVGKVKEDRRREKNNSVSPKPEINFIFLNANEKSTTFNLRRNFKLVFLLFTSNYELATLANPTKTSTVYSVYFNILSCTEKWTGTLQTKVRP